MQVPVLPDPLWGAEEELARMAAEEGRVWYCRLQEAMVKGDMRFRLPRDPVFHTAWRGEGKFGPSEEEDDDDEDYPDDSGSEIEIGDDDIEATGASHSGNGGEVAAVGEGGVPRMPVAGSAPTTPTANRSARSSPADAAASGADLFRRYSPRSGGSGLHPMIPRTPEEKAAAARQTVVLSPTVPSRRAPAASPLAKQSRSAPAALCMLRMAPEPKQVLAWLDRGGDPNAGRPLGVPGSGAASGGGLPNRLAWADADTARAELRQVFGAIQAVKMIRKLREEGEVSTEAVDVLANVAEGAVLLPHLISASASGGSISELAESRSGKGRLGYASSRESRPVLGMPGSGPAASMSAILARVRGRSAGVLPVETRRSTWERIAESGAASGGSTPTKLHGKACELNLSLDHRWLFESRYSGGSPQVTLVAPTRTSSTLLSVEERIAEDAVNEAFEQFATAAVKAWQGKSV